MRLFLLSIGCFMLLATGCKKDTRLLGVNVSDETDALNVETRTLPVSAVTVRGDSIISFSSTYKYLGANSDPYFGTTNIGICTNFNVSLTNLNFGSAPVLDSASVELVVNPYYGDVNGILTFSIFTLDSTLISTRNYYTSNVRTIGQQNLGTYTGRFGIYDSTVVVRIPVDKAYAYQLITDNAYLTDNATMQKKYKGFYITCGKATGAEGIIYQCNLYDGNSGFWVYYHRTAADPQEKFNFTFAGSTAANYNTVQYQPTGGNPSLLAQLNGTQKEGTDHLFVKGQQNTKVRVDISGIESLADSFKVSIDRAELVLNVDPQLMPTDAYKALPGLALVPIGATGRDTLAADLYNSTDASRYGGTYDDVNNQYVFNIARHVQAILNGQVVNRGFYLVAANPGFNYTGLRDLYVQRVVLAGTGSSAAPVFRVSYVKMRHQ